MSDSLRDILRHADRATGTPIVRGDVAKGVRRKAREQRLTRGIAAGAMAVMIGVGIFALNGIRGQRQVVAVTPLRPSAPRLDETDLKVAMMTAELVEDYENGRRTGAPASKAASAQEYLWQVSEEPNQTALILVRSADRIYQQSHDRPAAAASYRQAIRLFPDSPAAATARERLRNFGDKGSES